MHFLRGFYPLLVPSLNVQNVACHRRDDADSRRLDVICPNLGGMIVGGIAAYPEELDRHMMFERNQHGCSDWSAGNGGQCAAATPAFARSVQLLSRTDGDYAHLSGRSFVEVQ